MFFHLSIAVIKFPFLINVFRDFQCRDRFSRSVCENYVCPWSRPSMDLNSLTFFCGKKRPEPSDTWPFDLSVNQRFCIVVFHHCWLIIKAGAEHIRGHPSVYLPQRSVFWFPCDAYLSNCLTDHFLDDQSLSLQSFMIMPFLTLGMVQL